MSDRSTPATTHWQQVMWLGAGVGLLLTITILLTFVGIALWRAVGIIETQRGADLAFTFSSIGLVTLTLLRLLAVLIGAAISFTGLAVSFFAHERATKFGGEINTSETIAAKATLATYSPGIVGVVVGAVIIVFALFARSEHKYEGARTYTLSVSEAASQPASSQGSPAADATRVRSLEEVLANPASAPNR